MYADLYAPAFAACGEPPRFRLNQAMLALGYPHSIRVGDPRLCDCRFRHGGIFRQRRLDIYPKVICVLNRDIIRDVCLYEWE